MSRDDIFGLGEGDLKKNTKLKTINNKRKRIKFVLLKIFSSAQFPMQNFSKKNKKITSTGNGGVEVTVQCAIKRTFKAKLDHI
jgi:hypothetical protein